MLDDFSANRRTRHRRSVSGMLRRLRARFSPTAVFTQPAATPTDVPPVQTPANTDPTTPTPTPAPAQPTQQSTQPAPAAPATSAAPAATTNAAPPAATPSPAPPAAVSNTAVPTQAAPSAPATTSSISADTATIQLPATGATPSSSVHAPTLGTASRNVASATVAQGGAAASGSAGPSNSSSRTSPSRTPMVVGIVIAAIVGLALVFLVVSYFKRRNRDSEDTLRRQSMVLPDTDRDPVPPMTMNRGDGYGPSSVSMARHVMHDEPSHYAQPPMSHPYGNTGHAYSAHSSFTPGEIVSYNNQHMGQHYASPAVTPNSASPFFQPMGPSPIGSPVSVQHYDSAYDAQGQLLNRQPSNAAPQYLSRQPSAAANLTRQPSLPGTPVDTPSKAHYVDLSRSSVTPFQAQQYAEISRRLNTAPPMPLPSPAVAAVIHNGGHNEPEPAGQNPDTYPLSLGQTINPDQHLAAPTAYQEDSLPESPFADPQNHHRVETSSAEAPVDRPGSPQHVVQEPEEAPPAPPSPVLSTASSRVTSNPPTLPEIHIQQRAFSPVSLDFPLVPSSARPSPSPLSTSFDLPSAPAQAHLPDRGHGAVPASSGDGNGNVTPRPAKEGPAAPRPDTAYTMYDEEDAYAGI